MRPTTIANSNTSISATFDELWDRTAERVLNRVLVSRAICDTRLNDRMTHGDTFHRQYLSSLPRPRPTTRYVDGVLRETPYADETLTVNIEPEVWTDIADGDVTQAGIDLIPDLKAKLLPRVAEYIDGDVIAYGAQNAGLTIDDLTMNPSTGTSGLGVTYDASNIYSILARAFKKIVKTSKVSADSKPWVIASPDMREAMQLSAAARDTTWGDENYKNGMVGNNYAGFEVYQSASTYFTTSLAMATKPIDGDTLVFTFNADPEVDNGTRSVTITFKDTISTTANRVFIGSTVNDSRTNLANLFNNSESLADAGAGTTYNNFSQANKDLMALATATNDGTGGVTIKLPGYGAVTVTETLTDGTDGFTATKQIEHMLFGIGKPIWMVTQSGAHLEMKEYGGTQRKKLLSGSALYGRQVWRDTKFMLGVAKLNASGYGAA